MSENRNWKCNEIMSAITFRIEERKQWCKQRIKDINVLLGTGVYIDGGSEKLQSITTVPVQPTESETLIIQQQGSTELEPKSKHPSYFTNEGYFIALPSYNCKMNQK